MKKVLFLLLLILASSITAQNKNTYGIAAGFFYGTANVKVNGIDVSDNLKVSEGAAAYIGVLANFSLEQKWSLQPEFLYVFGGERGAILVPIMLKYQMVKSFDVMLGPQLDLFVNTPNTINDYINNLGLGVAVGASYNINKKFTVQAKYSLGLTQRFKDNISAYINESLGSFFENISFDNPSFRANSIQIGIVYTI